MVPYKEYTLVRSDGTAPERTKKHPFCMSRVHYSATGDYKLPTSIMHICLLPLTLLERLDLSAVPFHFRVRKLLCGSICWAGTLLSIF